MNDTALVKTWLREESHPFEGWDFSYLQGRMYEDQPPWSYLGRAAELMQGAASALDLDTGGGERLLDLRQVWPRRIIATENHPPNARLACERLSPLGVGVVEAITNETVALPFASGTFNLILNRNSSFHSAEIARILTLGGYFLTNQVHGRTLDDLLTIFGVSPQWPDATPERYIPMLEEAGMTILNTQNWEGKTRFSDVGAIVYYLKAVPWMVPNFSVRTHQDALWGLHKRIQAGGELVFTTRAYFIEARK